MPPPSLLSAASRPPSTAPPLSHHDILGLVEPFSRAGLKLDLSASDRMARKLVFRPAPADAERPASEPLPGSLDALPAHLSAHLSVHYQLDLAEAKRPELTRHLHGPAGSKAGMTARLQARGGNPAELLACIQAVPAQQQWLNLGQATVVLSHRIELPRPVPATAPTLVLTDAVAQVAGCRLHMRVPRVPGMPAELEMTPVDAPPTNAGPALSPARSKPVAAPAPEPPPDLLAVLGLRWSRLSRVRGSWRSTVQLSRREPARSSDALAKLLQAVAHLGQTLAEPPSRFHQRFSRARWAVTLRRATPLTVALGLIAAAAAVPVLDLGEGSVLRMLIFNSPPLLMVWMFALREFPRIELPPLPRVPLAGAWTALVSTPATMPATVPTSPATSTASDPPAFNPLPHQPPA